MRKKNLQGRKARHKKAAFLLFFLALLAMGLYNIFSYPYILVPDPQWATCPIEFGDITCFDLQAVIPFYNPNEHELSGIQVMVPKPNGVDVYKVDQPLLPNRTEALVLQTLPCGPAVKAEGLKVRWCCGSKCYESPLSKPTSDFELENTAPSENGSAETYPEHPKMEDCQKLKTYLREFCFDDAAEINSDLMICGFIEDMEIKKHCIGRISLNESMCREISDAGLRDGCLESIALKRQWQGGQ